MLNWIQDWFVSHCDKKWDEIHCIKIETIDNPGWLVRIEISDTELVNKPFSEVDIDISESDWIMCRIKGGQFEGVGDATKLSRILQIFRQWAES